MDGLSLCSRAQAFCQHYYQTFDNNRQALAPLYTDQSMLTFQVRGELQLLSRVGHLTSSFPRLAGQQAAGRPGYHAEADDPAVWRLPAPHQQHGGPGAWQSHAGRRKLSLARPPPPPAIRDSQPSVTNGIIIMVAGDIKVEGEERPLKFSQVCIPQGAASA